MSSGIGSVGIGRRPGSIVKSRVETGVSSRVSYGVGRSSVSESGNSSSSKENLKNERNVSEGSSGWLPVSCLWEPPQP